MSRKKPRLIVPIITLIFFVGLGLAVTGGIIYDKYNPASVSNSQSSATSSTAPVKEQPQEDGEDRIYMIRETKSTQQESLLRFTESAKIRAAKKHFKAIGIEDYAKASPDNWNLQ